MSKAKTSVQAWLCPRLVEDWRDSLNKRGLTMVEALSAMIEADLLDWKNGNTFEQNSHLPPLRQEVEAE